MKLSKFVEKKKSIFGPVEYEKFLLCLSELAFYAVLIVNKDLRVSVFESLYLH